MFYDISKAHLITVFAIPPLMTHKYPFPLVSRMHPTLQTQTIANHTPASSSFYFSALSYGEARNNRSPLSHPWNQNIWSSPMQQKKQSFSANSHLQSASKSIFPRQYSLTPPLLLITSRTMSSTLAQSISIHAFIIFEKFMRMAKSNSNAFPLQNKQLIFSQSPSAPRNTLKLSSSSNSFLFP